MRFHDCTIIVWYRFQCNATNKLAVTCIFNSLNLFRLKYCFFRFNWFSIFPGQYGFLSYEVDEGRKLFFHTSEVEGGESLQEGDEVEFVVITNKRTGKHSACCVRKLR